MENQQILKEKQKLPVSVFSPLDLLAHWQGHRSLTRRVIEAFPESELFQFSLGGMRPFAAMVKEFIDITDPGIDGIVSGNWGLSEEWDHSPDKSGLKTKQDILDKWDSVTHKINQLWPQIPAQRFQEVDVAFGKYEDTIYSTIFYFIDNEIHHRGQGYVYLRSLGIEPPPFWDR